MSQCLVDWDRLLAYLQLLLSWPPIVLVIFGVTVFAFKKEIAKKIDDLANVKAMGAEAGFKQGQVAAPIEPLVPLPPAPNSTLAEAVLLDVATPAGVTAPIAAPPAGNVSQTSTQSPHPASTSQPVEPVSSLAEHRGQQLGDLLKQNGQLLEALGVFQERIEFEQIYGVLYGTQFDALLAIRSATSPGPTAAEMQEYVNEHVKRTANADWSFSTLNDFMNMFMNAGLVERGASLGLLSVPRFAITAKGRRFLDYLNGTRKPTRPW